MEPWFLESQAFRASCNYELVLFTAAVMNNRRRSAHFHRGSASVESLISLQQATEQEEETLQQDGVAFTYLEDEDEG